MAGLTPQQQEAVYRRQVSVVLSSGAGCGKTHVLTQRYLSHLREDGAEVGQIVAITFTDRAARQMRGRIRQAVLKHLEEARTDEETARWERHLRGLETSQISTIHAFCANLLRQHAVEAGLDPRFDVLEDFLAVNLETEALTSCLQGLLTAKTPAGEDLRQLVLVYGWRPTVEAVRQLLRCWEPTVQKPWRDRPASDIAAEWQEYAHEELLPRYLGFLQSASPKIARCLWLLRTTPCQGPKMAANAAVVLEETPRLAGSDDLPAAVEHIKEAAKVTGTERAKAWASQDIYEQIQSALKDFREDLPKKLKLFLEPVENLEGEIEAGQRFLRVAEEAAQAYRELKRRHGVVDFQDLLICARDLLRDHSAVRERLQRRYQVLLIDELQDTDPVQMELVEYLAGAGLIEGKLFAVGDHSQSIYRFRGADVHLFQRLRRRMSFAGRLGLTLNFRSQPAILDFVNALLGPSAASSISLEDYQPLQAHFAQVNPDPCIEFLWTARAEGNVTEARTLEANTIARRIAQMVRQGEKQVVERQHGREELRPVQPGDVVLLFRAMTNVELYEAALRKYGLHYYLVGGRAFFAQQEIYDLLNLLRSLENPRDAVCLAGTLRSPFCCLSDEALFVLARHPDGLWVGLHDARSLENLPPAQRTRAEMARGNLDRWYDLKNRLPLTRLLGQILADSGYDAALQFEFLGDRKLANLWKLADLARRFDRSGLFGLAEFIGRLNDLVQTQPREEQAATQPENANVVRLMSIHQAKGLEFPVVILPDFGAEFGTSRYPVAVWDSRLGCVARPPVDDDPPPFSNFGWRLWQAGEAVADWREDLRTLYVACTRAQDYLILSAALPANFTPETPWLLALASRFDLHSGHCLVPGLPAERVPKIAVATEINFPDPPTPQEQAEPPPYPGPEILERIFQQISTPQAIGPGLPELDSTAPAFQWDAEDGSDRSSWPSPH